MAEFDESQHPRDESGRFTDGGGGGAATVATVAKAHNLVVKAHQNGGFTFSPSTGNFPSEGYAVSIHPEHEAKIKGKAALDSKSVAEYLGARKEFFDKNPSAHLGGWYNPDDDTWYLDVSHLTNDKKEAVSLGARYNQKGIYDLKAGQTITDSEYGEIAAGERGDSTGWGDSRVLRPSYADSRGDRGSYEGDPRRRAQGQGSAGRLDYDDDQPRDENGRWSDEGGGHTASPGKPFLVYRLAKGEHRDLNNRNAGNAEAVAHHIGRSQGNGGAPEGGFGDTVHVFKVKTKSDFGKYVRMNMGEASDPTDTPTKVGRLSKDFRGKDTTKIAYSFPENGEFESEHLLSVPVADLNAHLKSTITGRGYVDFDEVGSLEGGNVIRDYVHKKLGYRKDYDDDQPRDENGRWSSGGDGGGGGGSKSEAWKSHRVAITSDKDLYGNTKVGIAEWHEAPETNPAPMSREASRAKAAEIRAEAERVRAEMRAGRWEGTGDKSGWNVASKLENKHAKEALRAGYEPDKEIVDPDWDDMAAISQPGHLYRGMEDAEFNATVGAGKGVHSENRYSVKDIEGTNFGWEAQTANSYVNSGSSHPERTGKPNYIVEVKPDDTVTYNKTAGYPQTPVGEGLDHSRITRVWKFEHKDGKMHMKQIPVPPRAETTEADVMKGNFGIARKDMPQFEHAAVAPFLDNMDSRFGVTYNEKIKAKDLKASQATLHMGIVRNMAPENRKSPIIVSNDGYVLDGHHRWASVRLHEPEGEVTAHKVNLPIKTLLREALNDPNATRNDTVDLDDLTMKTRLDTAIERLQGEIADVERRLEALRVTRDTLVRMDAEWDESLHPRAADGKFGQGAGNAKQSKSQSTGAKPSVKPKLAMGSNKVASGTARSGREESSSFRPERKSPDAVDRALTGAGNTASAKPPVEPSKGLKAVGEAMGGGKPESAKLQQAHDKYFNTDKPGTQVIPLDKLLTIRARSKGIENAEKHMANAYKGEGKKRDPISVSANGDGTYSVEDGNSTTAIARKHGWDSLPVQVVPASDKGKAAHTEHKVQESLQHIKHVQEHGATREKNGKTVTTFLDKDVSLDKHREVAEKAIAKHAEGKEAFQAKLSEVGGVKFEGRVKALDSALGKVARKPHNYKTAADLQDLTGMRTTTKSVQQSRAIVEKLKKEFPEVQVEEKLEPHQVENGGYRAIHLVVKDHDGLYKEVQIQTERQRAFQEWSHDVYKPQTAEQKAAVGTEKNPGPHRAEALAYGNAMSLHFFHKDQGKDSQRPPEPHPAIRKVFGTPREL